MWTITGNLKKIKNQFYQVQPKPIKLQGKTLKKIKMSLPSTWRQRQKSNKVATLQLST